MTKPEYQNLGVKPETHYRVKLLAAERGINIDEMVSRLLDEFERQQKYNRMRRLTEEPLPVPEKPRLMVP